MSRRRSLWGYLIRRFLASSIYIYIELSVNWPIIKKAINIKSADHIQPMQDDQERALSFEIPRKRGPLEMT